MSKILVFATKILIQMLMASSVALLICKEAYGLMQKCGSWNPDEETAFVLTILVWKHALSHP